jgi:hypothetical protein
LAAICGGGGGEDCGISVKEIRSPAGVKGVAVVVEPLPGSIGSEVGEF